MEKVSVSRTAFVNLRVLLLLALFTGSIVVALFASATNGRTRPSGANPVGFRVGPALPKSAEIKTSPKTPAGSAHWFWQRPLPQGNPLYAASFADPNTEIAVGEDATILRTTDGGAHWTIKTSGYEGAGVELFGVSFSDASHANLQRASLCHAPRRRARSLLQFVSQSQQDWNRRQDADGQEGQTGAASFHFFPNRC